MIRIEVPHLPCSPVPKIEILEIDEFTNVRIASKVKNQAKVSYLRDPVALSKDAIDLHVSLLGRLLRWLLFVNLDLVVKI